MQRTWLRTAVVVVAVLVFCPLLFQEFQFVNLDDVRGIADNPKFRGQSVAQLEWMFTTPHMGHYQPRSWMSLGLDYLVWEMNPRGYHLTNLLLHLASAVTAFELFTRWLICVSPNDRAVISPAAAVGALVLAVHPLRAESVAWVTERRDVLSGCLYRLALLCYGRRAVAVRPGAVDPRRNLGILLANKLRPFDAAIVEFEVLARQQPRNPEPHYCIGLSRAGQQRHQLAVCSFLRTIRLQPDHRPAHQALGENHARLGNPAKSAEHYRIARRLGRR